MGVYIDPQNCSKERFLNDKGTRIPADAAKRVLAGGTHLPVCHVNNGPFTAAAIGYSDREIEHFMDERDPRPKQWFSVKREDLADFYPEAIADARLKSPQGDDPTAEDSASA